MRRARQSPDSGRAVERRGFPRACGPACSPTHAGSERRARAGRPSPAPSGCLRVRSRIGRASRRRPAGSCPSSCRRQGPSRPRRGSPSCRRPATGSRASTSRPRRRSCVRWHDRQHADAPRVGLSRAGRPAERVRRARGARDDAGPGSPRRRLLSLREPAPHPGEGAALGRDRALRVSQAARAGAVCGAVGTGGPETTWQLMEPGRSKTWWVWALCGPEAVVYRLLGTRSAAGAATMLGDYRGIVVCDGYAAYRALAKHSPGERAGPTITLAHCWAHVRRQYVEAETSSPQAAEVLRLLGELYAAEAAAQKTAAGAAAVVLRERRARAAPIVERIRTWVTQQRALPQSALGKALAYTTELWPGLAAFLYQAAIPVDNNATERALRGIALGRKNHYGSRSERGTRVAALCYTLLESAKLAGVEPAAYLAEATRRAIVTPGTVTLPRELAGA